MAQITSGAQRARSLGGGRRQQAQDNAMKAVHDWVKIYNDANDPAEKKLALDYGRAFVGSLPPQFQEAMKSTIEAGPFGAENMKREQWKLNNPRPNVTVDAQTSPYLHAEQIFRQKDWESTMNKVVYGKDSFTPNLLGISADQYATRDKNGNVSIYSAADFEERGKATRLGKPLSEFIAGGGRAKIDEKRTFTNPWGGSTVEQAYIDLDGTKSWSTEAIDRQAKETQEDKRLRAFHTNFLNMNTDDPLVANLDVAMENEEPIQDIVDNIISPAFPGYTFLAKGNYVDNLGSFDLKNFKLQFFKGKEVVGKQGDKRYKFWWSVTPQGKVVLYNKSGNSEDNADKINDAVKKYNIPIPPDFVGRF